MNIKIKLFSGGKFNEAKLKDAIEKAVKGSFRESIEAGFVKANPDAIRMECEYEIKVGKNVRYICLLKLGVKNNTKGVFEEYKILTKQKGDMFSYSENTIKVENYHPWDINDEKHFKKGPPNRETAAEFLCGKIHESCVSFMDFVAEMDKDLLVAANNKLKNVTIIIDIHSGSYI